MYFKEALPEKGAIISCIALNNVYIVLINFTFYCLAFFYKFIIQIYVFFFLLNSLF